MALNRENFTNTARTHSQQTWEADSWTLYTGHTNGKKENARGAPSPQQPPALPVHAVRCGHHPVRGQHGAPACVPGTQGHAGLPGPAPGSHRLPAHYLGSQGPGPTLCKQTSTGEMERKRGGCQHCANGRGLWSSVDGSRLSFLALSMGREAGNVGYTSTCPIRRCAC